MKSFAEAGITPNHIADLTIPQVMQMCGSGGSETVTFKNQAEYNAWKAGR